MISAGGQVTRRYRPDQSGLLGLISDNALLRLRRRRLRKTRREMAEALGISERALAYYEQNRPVPKAIMLAVEALSGGISAEMRMGRDRWVTAVDNLLRYGQGEAVVGRLLRERRIQVLSDMLDLARYGPEAATALTDPALFRALRDAATKAYLAGLLVLQVSANASEGPTGMAVQEKRDAG